MEVAKDFQEFFNYENTKGSARVQVISFENSFTAEGEQSSEDDDEKKSFASDPRIIDEGEEESSYMFQHQDVLGNAQTMEYNFQALTSLRASQEGHKGNQKA